MADIEARAEAEAAHKGLSGSARKSYIGGVWNRIRQAHAKATQPGGHAVPTKLFNRRARQQAREDARNAMRPHQEAIANIKKARDWRLGRHRDEPKPTEDRAATAPTPVAAPAPRAAPRPAAAPAAKRQPQGFPKPLTPIKPLPGFQLDATRRLDPYFIREYFGDAQLPEALSRQTPNNLHEAIEVIQEKTGKRYSGARSAPAMRAWILANM